MIKLFKFLLVIAVALFTSCSKLHPEGGELEGEALLKIGLSVDSGVEVVTKGEDSPAMNPETVPHVDNMYVELYRYGKKLENGKDESGKDQWRLLYFGKYEEAKTKTFRVNAGNWKLISFSGDSTACGFEKPFFHVEKDFEVKGGVDDNGQPNITTVEATAKVENVRIKVNFDETVSGSYYDYFVRFSNIDTLESRDPIKYKQVLRYKKGETRDAYMMPTQKLKIEFMAQYEYGQADSWKYTTLVEEMPIAGNDFLQVNLKVTNPREGKLDVNITTDDNIVREDTNVEILEIWAPQDPPQVVAAGFNNGDHAVVEGDNTGNSATVSVVARAGLKHFYLTINSEYLTSENGFDIPLGEQIDLVNPSTVAAGYLDKLKAAGFEWDEDMTPGSRDLTYLKMTKLFESINSKNPSLQVERNLATFKIEVVDDVEHSTSRTLTATAYPITQTLSIPEGRVWSNKIVSPEVAITKGVSSLFRLEVSTDGETWNDLTGFYRVDNSVLDYGTLTVEPNTTYHYRSVYNDNPNLISNVVTVTTESELQIGNPGFEEYHSTVMHVEPLGLFYNYDRTWYLPYKEGETDTWWAVNSKKTMPDGHTAWTSNWCKNFPCTAYSIDAHTGEKSALVYTVNVGSGNTDGTAVGTNVPGEIWLGKADNDGNHTADGHPFASRPASIKFWYKYQPVSGETFVVNVSVKDKDGREIARAEKLDGAMASEWTQCEMPIVYSDTETRAATLYVSFKSCSSGSVNTAVSMEIAGSQQTAHIGSALRIDDIELTY